MLILLLHGLQLYLTFTRIWLLNEQRAETIEFVGGLYTFSAISYCSNSELIMYRGAWLQMRQEGEHSTRNEVMERVVKSQVVQWGSW